MILLATGVAMVFNLDVRFEDALAKDTSLPAIFIDPTQSLENSNAVQNRLASLRPPSRFAERQAKADATAKPAAERVGRRDPRRQDPGAARARAPRPRSPTTRTGSTPPATAADARGLRGHVVLVDFWTYTCINCIRTLPFLKGLYATYHRYGLDIVGVETPEFTFEQNASNVRQAISADGITYPVVQDNRYGTWNAYQNQYWPAEYLIDAQGEVRHTQFGEGDYEQDEAAVRQLLFEAGARHLPPPITADAIMPSTGLARPRPTSTPSAPPPTQEKWSQPLQRGTHTYHGTTHRRSTSSRLTASGTSTTQSATAVSIGRLDHRHLPGPARLPGDDLGRQRAAHGSGADRRQADRRVASRRRRP